LNYWFNMLRRVWGGLPYEWSALAARCPECDPPHEWPTYTQAYYVYAALALQLLVHVIGGAWPRVTSGLRCRPCNTRRGGADQSRHLGGQSGGKPYAAFDVQWDTTAIPRALYENWVRNGRFQRLFRRWTGTNLGIGIIFYGTRIHLDVREHDYVEVKPDAW